MQIGGRWEGGDKQVDEECFLTFEKHSRQTDRLTKRSRDGKKDKWIQRQSLADRQTEREGEKDSRRKCQKDRSRKREIDLQTDKERDRWI